MIETIFRVTIILVVVSIVLAVIDTIVISVRLPFEYASLLTSILHVVAYILPMNNLLPLFGVVVSMAIFRVTIAILKTIWDLLPIRA